VRGRIEESRGTEEDDEAEAESEGETGSGTRLVRLVILTRKLKRKERRDLRREAV